MSAIHISTDALEALAWETGARVEVNAVGTRFLRVGNQEFWARPDADQVVVPLVGRTSR